MTDTNQGTEQNIENVSKQVLDRIEAGDISMHSKARFLLKLILLITSAVAVITLSAAILSFILFGINQSGNSALIGFDTHELIIFLRLFPWNLLLLDVVALLCFELLLRQFTFGYRRSMLSLLLLAAVLSIAIAFVLDQSRANDAILRNARNHSIPFFGGIYDKGHLPPARELGICRCIIQSIDPRTGTTLYMYEDDPFGSTTLIGLLPQGFATSGLVIGRPVLIVGDIASDTIRIINIQVLQKRR